MNEQELKNVETANKLEVGKKYELFIQHMFGGVSSYVGVVNGVRNKTESQRSDVLIFKTGNGTFEFPFLMIKDFNERSL